MKKNKLFAVLTILGTATLAACGGPDAANTESGATAVQGTSEAVEAPAAAASEAAGEVYSGTGDVTGISDDKVTISHGPIAGIDWPAMTMGFSTQSPEMLRGLKVGDPVAFQFRKAGSDYAITSINKAQ